MKWKNREENAMNDVINNKRKRLEKLKRELAQFNEELQSIQ